MNHLLFLDIIKTAKQGELIVQMIVNKTVRGGRGGYIVCFLFYGACNNCKLPLIYIYHAIHTQKTSSFSETMVKDFSS